MNESLRSEFRKNVRGLVSKETVVLSEGNSNTKIWYQIKRVDNGQITSANDEGLTLEM